MHHVFMSLYTLRTRKSPTTRPLGAITMEKDLSRSVLRKLEKWKFETNLNLSSENLTNFFFFSSSSSFFLFPFFTNPSDVFSTPLTPFSWLIYNRIVIMILLLGGEQILKDDDPRCPISRVYCMGLRLRSDTTKTCMSLFPTNRFVLKPDVVSLVNLISIILNHGTLEPYNVNVDLEANSPSEWRVILVSKNRGVLSQIEEPTFVFSRSIVCSLRTVVDRGEDSLKYSVTVKAPQDILSPSCPRSTRRRI